MYVCAFQYHSLFVWRNDHSELCGDGFLLGLSTPKQSYPQAEGSKFFTASLLVLLFYSSRDEFIFKINILQVNRLGFGPVRLGFGPESLVDRLV